MMKRYAHATPDSRSRAMKIIERELGGDPGENGDAQLREIFAAAQSREIAFNDFKKSLESFYGYFTRNAESDVADVADVKTFDSNLIQ